MFKEISNKPIRFLVILIYLIIILICCVELNFLWLFGYSPNKKEIVKPTLSVASELYTSDSVLIGRYYNENRIPITYKEIPKSVIDALVATEDVRFYKHSGVDYYSIFSGLISTFKGDTRGASTITQQLAKNLYRTRNKKSQGLIKYIPLVRTLTSKFKEWLTAYKIESNFTKEEILTMYLNTVPFGYNSFGLNTASKKYFSKPVIKLTVDEGALLIGTLKATSTYNPIKNPEKSVERRNVVLTQMKKYNYLSENDFELYSKKPLKLNIDNNKEESDGNSYLRVAVSKWLDSWCEENEYNLKEDGLKIYTTIDSKLQKYAEEAVKEQMKILQRRFDYSWGDEKPWRDAEGNEIENYIEKAAEKLWWYPNLSKKYNSNPDSIKAFLNQKKKMTVFSWEGEKDVKFSTYDSLAYYAKTLNTGMMTLDPFNGHIKVWVGGDNYNYFQYDHVNQSKRQAGSTFKPFAYLAALESGMNPCDRFTDKPVKIKFKNGNKDEYWEPKNSNYSFSYSSMTLRRAMAKSVNSITAQVTDSVGSDKVVECAHRCGVDSKLLSVPSVGLGSNDVSVFEMVKAYGTFLNKGQRVEPILVERITDLDDNFIADFTAKTKKALSEEIAWLMLYMFRGGMEEQGGTSQALWEWDLWKHNNQIGGKTGTSSDYVDGWYMGITKDLVTGIWVGADDRSIHFKTSETGEGSKTALPIFGKFMEKVYKDASTHITQGPFPKPTVKITRIYNCPQPIIAIDTFSVDSSFTDSIAEPLPNEINPDIENQEPEVPKSETQKLPTINPSKTNIIVPKPN